MSCKLDSYVRGAVYIPTTAYNAVQQWRNYSHERTVRDLGYAKSVNINALRLWMSYEYWIENKEGFEKSFEDLLCVADSYGIKVMPSMFECCGREPSAKNIEDTDQFTGSPVRSPGTAVTNDISLWTGPFSFIDWFCGRYNSDNRILALEVTNEPKSVEDHRFAVALIERARKLSRTMPVTVGSQEFSDNIIYANLVDVFQTHENIHLSVQGLRTKLGRLKMVEEYTGKPVWITEWQRFRKSGLGFASESVDKNEVRPFHAPMAELYREYNVGNFIWSLMLKPAYLTGQRKVGTFSGLFHEDGCVYSLDDARAVSGNPELVLPEKHELPECFSRVAAISEE